MSATASRIEEARERMRWQDPPVHPAAAKLPMMSSDELDELARDIRTHGMLQPIILWENNTEVANGATGPFPTYLLDGRNRIEALKRAGFDDPNKAPRGDITGDRVRTMYAVKRVSSIGGGTIADGWVPDVNPVTFVLSANVHRRHLTAEQKREAIAVYIAADPLASDRKVAKELGISHTTVADVRKKAPNGKAPNGQVGQMEHRPVERAKQILRENRTAKPTELAKLAGVGMSTAYSAYRQLLESGEISEQLPRAESTPKPEAEPKKKDRQGERLSIAIQELATHTREQEKLIKTIARLAVGRLTGDQKITLTTQAETLHNYSIDLKETATND